MSERGAERIGVIGLGNMGGRMAARLVEAGRRVLGYDRDPGRAAAHGVTPAADVAEVVQNSDHVLLSLPDSRAVEAVVEGEGGVLASARSGQVVVDLSTAAPASTRRLHAVLAERGVALVDAGISGGAAAADKGTLTLMVGGDAEAIEAVRPTVDAFTKTLFPLGRPGAGHSAKLINNFLNAINLSATAEALVAGRRAGLDPEQLLEVINASSGANWASQNRFPHIVHGDYLEGGLTSALMLKDLTLYVEHLHDIGVSSLHASGPIAGFGLAGGLGYGDQISNRVVDALGDLAGGVRLHDADADDISKEQS